VAIGEGIWSRHYEIYYTTNGYETIEKIEGRRERRGTIAAEDQAWQPRPRPKSLRFFTGMVLNQSGPTSLMGNC
jgi:hypothetical protein